MTAENEAQSLRDEIEFMKQVHESVSCFFLSSFFRINSNEKEPSVMTRITHKFHVILFYLYTGDGLYAKDKFIDIIY